MKTFSLKKADISRQWHIIDARQVPLGRIATLAASLLIGKLKPSRTAHMDDGDYVIIINTSEMAITGNKLDKKIYYRHSGFPGGIHQRTLRQNMEKSPPSVLRQAIRGMLPDNKLRQARLKRLKIYTGPEHEHNAQNPQRVELKDKRK